MRRVAARFQTRARAEGRPLEPQPAPGVVVQADPARLEQALANLVDNALSYGDGAVALSAGARTATVELHVCDEGDGFPPAFLPHAFERFSRADQARGGGGAGLGLAIAAAVAQAHGGSAHASNRDRGADVWISSLPLSSINSPDTGSMSRHASAGGRGRDQDGEPDPAWSALGGLGRGRRHQGRGRAVDGRVDGLRRDRARRHAPRHRRLRDVPAVARGRDLVARDHAHRARRGRGPRGRPGRRRRRLSGEAVLVRRAARPAARAGAPRAGGAPAGARGRHAEARPGVAPRLARRHRGQPVGQGVPAAGDVHAPPR